MQSRYVLLTFVLALAMAGCSDAPRRGGPRGGAMGEPPPMPSLSAEESFADGQLLVEATLSRGESPGRGGGPGGGRGRRHHGPPPDMEGMGGPGGEEEGGMARQSRFNDSPMPPVMLKLHVTNKGAAPLDVVFIECNSALGNFGIRPERATIQPGQSVDPDRMTSLLGVSGEDLPVTVTLKINGKLEKRTLTLHVTPAAPSA